MLYLIIFIAAPSGAATATPTKMLITLACDTVVSLVFYELLKPVNRTLSLLALSLRLVFVAVMAGTSLDYFAGLLNGAHASTAFNAGYNIALVFFGFHCLLIGYLIARSAFLPRILGALMALAGAGWLINSLASFLSAPLANRVWPYVVAAAILGEGLLTLWLLVRGVNAQRWNEQASAAGYSVGGAVNP